MHRSAWAPSSMQQQGADGARETTANEAAAIAPCEKPCFSSVSGHSGAIGAIGSKTAQNCPKVRVGAKAPRSPLQIACIALGVSVRSSCENACTKPPLLHFFRGILHANAIGFVTAQKRLYVRGGAIAARSPLQIACI